MIEKRNVCVVFIIILFTAILSCRHNEPELLSPELKRAEALMYVHPDSALRILEKMAVPTASDEFQNAVWSLLMTQARDKNYLKPASDSLINVAYKYFVKQDNPHWRALAFNYKGAVCQQLGDVEASIQDYLDAASEVERTTDYQLAYLVYANLGVAYTYRSINTYAMEALQKAYEYAKLSGNKVYISASLSYIARVYSVQSEWAKALEYYKKAEEMAEASGNEHEIGCVKGEASMIYAILKNYDLALRYAKEALHIAEKEKIGIEQSMLRIGDIYRLQGVNDSAYYYCNKALSSDNIYTLRSAYHLLYVLSKKQAKYAEAVTYNEKMWNYSDSIHNLERNRAVIEIQEKYNQQKVLNEKNQLQIEKERTVRIGLSILLILLCGILVVVYIYQHKLLQKQKQLQESKDKVCEYQQKIDSNEVLMSKNRSRIDELLRQVIVSRDIKEQTDEEYQELLMELQCRNEKLHNENDDLQNKISRYSASVQEEVKNRNLLNKLSRDNQQLRERESFLCDELVKRSKLLNDLKASPKYLDVVLWDKVRVVVNELYDNFERRLQKEFPFLTESDIQLCCLIKLRFSISTISIMRGVSPSSISQQKTRLKKRLATELGDAFNDFPPLDVWVWDY